MRQLPLWFAWLVLLGPPAHPAPQLLTVMVQGGRNAGNWVEVSLYGPQQTLGRSAPLYQLRAQLTSARTASVAFRVPAGRYAVAAYEDVNGNGRLDQNFIGIPTEPVGFSNGVRPRFSAPAIRDMLVTVPSVSQVTLSLAE